MKKIITGIIGFLVCVSLIRTINGAEPISITDLLIEVQSLKYNITDTYEILTSMIEFEREWTFLGGWNNNLTGFEGFVINLKNVLVYNTIYSFKFIIETIKVPVSLTVNMAKLFIQIFEILAHIMGADISEGHRGGR